jgi:glycosyltransferase involved in cell wall biosynthesis
VKGHFDRQFGSHVGWDIPLLEGYTSRFFKNRSRSPSIYNGFFGLINPGLLRALWKQPKSIVIVHGWNYFTHVMALIIGRLAGHTVCIRGESPLSQELVRSKANIFFKRFFLQRFLFAMADRCLFIGQQNRKFYEFYRVPVRKLLFTPYAVDNDRFRAAAKSIDKIAVRKQLNIQAEAFVILYTAKFISKKRPMDLLKAYQQLTIKNKCLVMVGDGELKQEIESTVKRNDLSNVLLPGFVNQSEIVKYYAAADVFVLCSGHGETWGLSVNEAMNFDLPVVVSHMAGCSDDLVTERSGYAYDTGSIDQLAAAIGKCHAKHDSFKSSEVVRDYSYDAIRGSLLSLLDAR